MLIHLLRSLYDPEQPMPLDLNVDMLLAEIKLFAIAPQVYHLLNERLNRVDSTDQADQAARAAYKLRRALEESYLAGLQHSCYMKTKEAELLRAFEALRLPAIPLKGVQFAERCFGHYAARTTGDLDLYIPRAYYPEAVECLECLGYTFEILKDHHARLSQGELMVELHLAFDKPYWSEIDPGPFQDASESLEPYRSIRQLSVQHTFYFIALHGARHQMDSVKYLLDIVQMLHRFGERIDFVSLLRQAEKDKTSRRLRTVLSIVYEQFPHLRRMKPLPFRPLNCRWNYDTIRNAKLGRKDLEYYRYKLHFKHLIFDSWKYALYSLRKSY
ncbi:nucleotidyltransferase family protein [Cohnella lubricantis]|uniref:Nucleotidyltransferase family protein n=1 Tax=Cohnella lubricantis TaxID=2163172 RepID=A0A841TBS4_9BACL|nr:nucleotidyltransferase family protein [Cohnella lubricantis]MBB6676828.1 nucleotidyltransferase family protein [Cohnella lubricantis]MBP2119407.1 hypothetical protein [Cohnella lubricantis]